MRRSSFKILSPMFLAMAVGCGGAPNASTPLVSPPVPVKPERPRPAEPDRSPVAAPAGLFAVGRVRAPARLVDRVLEWAALPLDWRRLLASEGKGLAKVVDLDVPIEFAAALVSDGSDGEPTPLAVISAGLSSLDDAVAVLREAGVDLSEEKPGVYRLDPNGDTSCAIAVALGSSPARVVCSDEAGLAALLPFAARGLPTMAISEADVSLQLMAKPAQERFAPELRRMRQAIVPWLLREFSLDSPSFDRALVEALQGGANELFTVIEHADKLTLEARLDESRQSLAVEAALTMRSSNSVLSQTVTEFASRAAVPSPRFWGLPSDAESVSWSDWGGTRGTDALRESAVGLLQGWLEHQGIDKSAIQGVPHLVDLVVGPGRPLLTSSGTGPALPAGSTEAPRWFAYGLASPLKEVERGLDAAVSVGKSPAFRRANADWAFKATKERRVPKGIRGQALEYRVVLPSALASPSALLDGQATPSTPAHSPRHAAERERKRTTKASDPAYVIIAFQSGDVTWLVGAEDRAGAEWGLRQVVGPSQSPLEREPGLEPLRANQGFCAGAMSMRGILNSFIGAGVLPPMSARPGAAHETVWMPYVCTATSSGDQVQIGMKLELPRAFFSEATQAMLSLVGAPFAQ